MKRILTYTLLLVILTLSVHPVIILHFCKGEMHSFTVVPKNEASSYCVSSDINQYNSFNSLISYPTIFSESCCLYKRLELITDNFILEQNNTPIQKPIVSSFLSLSAILDYLANSPISRAIIKNNSHISSIVFYSTLIKFLSFISVYRL